MSLAIYSLTDKAAQIDQPFAMVLLGLIGDIGVHLYVAQGQMDWHKHIDEDELFIVHEGGLRIDSELGKNTLYPEEALLVPKGVGHRSQSALRSVVLLFRQQILPERKNGHRNYLVTEGREPLAKARLSSFANENSQAFEPTTVAMMEGYRLTFFRANGFGPAETCPSGGTLLYVTQGAIGLELDDGGARLEQGQLTILPPHTTYKLHAAQPAMVLKFEHE
jgi:mannose-6-phosphate isomerase-like protein (cupin superfamily)